MNPYFDNNKAKYTEREWGRFSWWPIFLLLDMSILKALPMMGASTASRRQERKGRNGARDRRSRKGAERVPIRYCYTKAKRTPLMSAFDLKFQISLSGLIGPTD